MEVHVDLNQGGCAVDGGGSVDASASVAVDCAYPSVAQGSHDAVPTSRHEDSDVGIEKPLENVAPAASVVASLSVWCPMMFRKYREGSLMWLKYLRTLLLTRLL